jgi:hypothetical protein
MSSRRRSIGLSATAAVHRNEDGDHHEHRDLHMGTPPRVLASRWPPRPRWTVENGVRDRMCRRYSVGKIAATAASKRGHRHRFPGPACSRDLQARNSASRPAFYGLSWCRPERRRAHRTDGFAHIRTRSTSSSRRTGRDGLISISPPVPTKKSVVVAAVDVAADDGYASAR